MRQDSRRNGGVSTLDVATESDRALIRCFRSHRDRNRTHLPGSRRNHPGKHRVRLADHDRTPRLGHPGLLAGDPGRIGPQILGVIQTDSHDGGYEGIQHIRGIQPPTEAHLDNRNLGPPLRHIRERDGGDDLEEAGVGPRNHRVQPFGPHHKRLLRHGLAVHDDPLPHVDEMRRRIHASANTPCLERGCHQRTYGSLAIGPRDVNGGEVVLRIPQCGQQRPSRPERPFRASRGTRRHPVEHLVEGGIQCGGIPCIMRSKRAVTSRRS